MKKLALNSSPMASRIGNRLVMLMSFEKVPGDQMLKGRMRFFRGMRPNAQGKFLLSFLPVKNYATISAIEVIAE